MANNLGAGGKKGVNPSAGQRSAAAVRAAQQTTQRNAALGTRNYGANRVAAQLPGQIKAKTAQTNTKQTALNAATLANQAKVAATAAAVKQAAERAQAQELASRLAAAAKAAALATAVKNLGGTSTAPSTGGSYGGASGGGTVAPVSTAAVAPTTTTTPVSTPVTTTTASTPTAPVSSFTTTGNGVGRGGSFERRRNRGGPQAGVSVTPDMLRRLAAQRITNRS